VKIRRTNLVVANAVDLGEDRLRALVDHIGGRIGAADLRHRLFKVVWGNLTHVAELGSLIQVREAVERVLDDWVTARAREKGMTKTFGREEGRQLELGSIGTQAERQRVLQLELERKVFEAEAHQLQQELLAAIEAEAAEIGADPAERLFAEDTARGLKLLQVLSRRYDVVVMNPPYGGFVPKVKEFVKAAYPLTANDIYAAFIDRATQLSEAEGYIGALVPSSFKANARFEPFRRQLLLKRNPLLVMLDLGEGILDDATNETAAIVVRGVAR
jgi:hypothetical protein